MHDAITRLVPAAAKFTRQIIPPVIATLIAAGLISAYNRAFTGHLQQPRMAALHQDSAEAASEPMIKPLVPTEAVAIYDKVAPPARLWEKEAKQESGKDQAIRFAEPAPAPVRTAAPPLQKIEPRAEPRRLAIIEPAPAIRAPAPAVATPVIVAAPPPAVAPSHTPAASALPTVQELRQPVLPPPQAQPHYQQPQYGQPQYQPPQYQQPPYQQQPQYAQPPYQQPQYQQPPYQPPVITAQPVTVPDRARATEPAQTETPNPPQGPIGKFVDTLKPSSLLARAREFGEKIEQAGNDILPNIRQQ